MVKDITSGLCHFGQKCLSIQVGSGLLRCLPCSSWHAHTMSSLPGVSTTFLPRSSIHYRGHPALRTYFSILTVFSLLFKCLWSEETLKHKIFLLVGVGVPGPYEVPVRIMVKSGSLNVELQISPNCSPDFFLNFIATYAFLNFCLSSNVPELTKVT